MRDSSVSLSELDHRARQAAHRGATVHVVYMKDDGGALLIYTYTPENVQAADDDPEHTRIYMPEDIIRWYQKQGVQPQEVKMPRSGKRLVVPITTTAAPTTETPFQADEETETPAAQPHVVSGRVIELKYNVADFPVVRAEHFKPVLAETLMISLYSNSKTTGYHVGRIALKGVAAKKDGTPSNAAGHVWFNSRDEIPDWLAEIVNEKAASYLAGNAPTAADADDMTDEELWNSPLGHRLRNYADKLLLAEEERIPLFHKRQVDGVVARGVSRARALVHPLGDPSPIGADIDEVQRPDFDPWANWQSPEVVGLREAVQATDGSLEAAQEAAKAYIAGLQGDERPTAEEPTETVPANDDEEPPTPTDVAGALSYLLTGHVASDRGPFAVHAADGFHDEPYVILSLDAMNKVLGEIPKERW
ncbi:hypothetical protein ACFQ6C_26615 [Streptomyces sp. NPDC056454]|uniref:hypothetical protein n=1 Tax=Streptomyces sp. NPDC056454 TaxID=3345823 RepID=UPI0036AEE4BF